MSNRTVDVAIIGAGTAGLAALSQVRRVTDNFVLIDGGELGTTCARVGCMPSKAIIQIAGDFHRRHVFGRFGIRGSNQLSLEIPEALEHVRDLRDIFVDRVLAGTTDNMGTEFIRGYARFLEPQVLEVNSLRIRAEKTIVAIGSNPVVPEAWRSFTDRVLTTDNIFEQERLPKSIAVVGLGVIGLEIGQALSRMGVEIIGVDALETIGGISDPAVNQTALTLLGKEFPMYLGRPADIRYSRNELVITSDNQDVRVDKILACLGRRPDLKQLGFERLGIDIDKRGIPKYDPETMQIQGMPIFIAGDANADSQILHEAIDEGRIAGCNAVATEINRYKRRTPLLITFTDPNIASVGTPFTDLEHERLAVGEVRFGPVGRALLMGKNKGLLRVYGDHQNGRLWGGSMIAPEGEHLAHLLAWSIQQGQTVHQLLQMPFYHPALEEGLQAALRDLQKNMSGSTHSKLELEPIGG